MVENDTNEGLVARHHFSNEGVACEDRFEAWRNHIRPIARLEPHADGSSNGVFSMTRWVADDMVFASGENPGARFHVSPRDVINADHDHLFLFLLTSGRSRITLGSGLEVDATAGTLALHASPQSCEASMTKLSAISVFLPARLFAGNAEKLRTRSAVTLNNAVGKLLGDYLLLVRGSLPQMTSRAANGVASSVSQLLLAACLGNQDSLHEAAQVIDIATKARIRQFIDARLCDRTLSPQLIMENFGLSRATLYRMFQADGGVKSYITGRRLAACLRMMKRSQVLPSIKQLSSCLGFFDGADLGRSFKRHYGFPLQDIRRALRENRDMPQPDVWSDWNAALRHLG